MQCLQSLQCALSANRLPPAVVKLLCEGFYLYFSSSNVRRVDFDTYRTKTELSNGNYVIFSPSKAKITKMSYRDSTETRRSLFVKDNDKGDLSLYSRNHKLIASSSVLKLSEVQELPNNYICITEDEDIIVYDSSLEVVITHRMILYREIEHYFYKQWIIILQHNRRLYCFNLITSETKSLCSDYCLSIHVLSDRVFVSTVENVLMFVDKGNFDFECIAFEERIFLYGVTKHDVFGVQEEWIMKLNFQTMQNERMIDRGFWATNPIHFFELPDGRVCLVSGKRDIFLCDFNNKKLRFIAKCRSKVEDCPRILLNSGDLLYY